jgi:hypothetical protein
MHSPDKLIPGQSLIYERADGVTYARYRDPPHNKLPRWIVGGDPKALSKANGELFDYAEWKDMMEEAKNNSVLKKYLQKAVEVFYLTKETQ